MRLIDADSINYHDHTECMGHGDFETVRTVTDKEIAEMPTVDAALVQHGKWIPRVDTDAPMHECSVCGARVVKGFYEYDNPNKYCYHCGAKMDLED